jgi:hypothetical protein
VGEEPSRVLEGRGGKEVEKTHGGGLPLKHNRRPVLMSRADAVRHHSLTILP